MKHAFIDVYADLNTPLHRMDARLKVVVLFLLLFLIIFSPIRNIPLFVFYAASTMALTCISRIPAGFIIKRAAGVLPFIVIISVSALFRKGGLVLFLNCLIKSMLAMFLVLLVSSTTKFNELLVAFRQLKMPGLFVSLLSFMYRYLFLLEDEVLKKKRAYESRNINNRNNLGKARVLGNILGIIFIHTYERAERVYLAMCARGYDGKESN